MKELLLVNNRFDCWSVTQQQRAGIGDFSKEIAATKKEFGPMYCKSTTWQNLPKILKYPKIVAGFSPIFKKLPSNISQKKTLFYKRHFFFTVYLDNFVYLTCRCFCKTSLHIMACIQKPVESVEKS